MTRQHLLPSINRPTTNRTDKAQPEEVRGRHISFLSILSSLDVQVSTPFQGPLFSTAQRLASMPLLDRILLVPVYARQGESYRCTEYLPQRSLQTVSQSTYDTPGHKPFKSWLSCKELHTVISARGAAVREPRLT